MDDRQSTIYVLATTPEATREALATAVPLARGAGARLVVLLTQVVPFTVEIDRPVDSSELVVQRCRDAVEALSGEASIRLCLCRRPEDVSLLLPASSTVVFAGRTQQWFQRGDAGLLRHLTRLGHRVVFVPMTDTTIKSTAAARVIASVVFACALMPRVAHAQDAPQWQYGAFLDAAVLGDAQTPANHLFRNRGTTPDVGELDVNMTGAYVRKTVTASSRFGFEATAHTGKDSETFGFSATAPNLGGAAVLRHLGPTDINYLAPVGKGLTIQGGIFSSLIGYDSLYAKDNLNYTRPWGADYTPYLMLGVNAAYPVTERFTATAMVVNGYWHLAHANDAPSVGGQLAFKANDEITLKQTVLYGSHQPETGLANWRVLSDTWLERKTKDVTVAAEYQFGSEDVVAAGNARAQWMAAQLPIQWRVGGPWAVTVRPEFAWDRDGRWIGAPESVTALTATLEYRAALGGAQAIVRGEYRVDNSGGAGGGFFADSDNHLIATQNLFIVAAIFTFDGTIHR